LISSQFAVVKASHDKVRDLKHSLQATGSRN